MVFREPRGPYLKGEALRLNPASPALHPRPQCPAGGLSIIISMLTQRPWA